MGLDLVAFALASVNQMPEIVWGKVTTTTTDVEFKHLYPTKKAEAVIGCPAKLIGSFTANGMKYLSMTQDGIVPGCREKVSADLEARFGETTVKKGSAPTLMGFTLSYTYREWNVGSLKIIMRAFSGRDYSFTVLYRRRR